MPDESMWKPDCDPIADMEAEIARLLMEDHVTARLLLVGGPSDGRTYTVGRLPTAWEVRDADGRRPGLYYPISDLSRRGYDVPPLRARTDEWLMLWDGWRPEVE